MTQSLFTSPQEVEQAFYEALQRADLDAMMAVWAEDDEVYCVHPGGPRLLGLEQIRESWRQIFTSGANMRVQLRDVQQTRGGLLAVHSMYEHVALIEERGSASVVAATNVYLNIGGGWRMIAHHASLVADAPAQHPPAESAPRLLH